MSKINNKNRLLDMKGFSIKHVFRVIGTAFWIGFISYLMGAGIIGIFITVIITIIIGVVLYLPLNGQKVELETKNEWLVKLEKKEKKEREEDEIRRLTLERLRKDKKKY